MPPSPRRATILYFPSKTSPGAGSPVGRPPGGSPAMAIPSFGPGSSERLVPVDEAAHLPEPVGPEAPAADVDPEPRRELGRLREPGRSEEGVVVRPELRAAPAIDRGEPETEEEAERVGEVVEAEVGV